MPSFEPLIKLFRGDTGKVRRVLGIFQCSTRDDLAQLDRAYADGSRAVIGQIAHKMKSACLQIGDVPASDALESLERALALPAGDEAVAREFSAARKELCRMMERVAAYLAEAPGAGG